MSRPDHGDAIPALLVRLLTDPKYRPALAIVKGVRNGIVYGCKIRFPHALVMTLLFKSGSLRDKLFAIVRATYTHASNLACFVIVYKSVCLLLLKVFSHGSRHLHTLVGAFLGGYFVFGAKNNINEQINMYLLSRVAFGLVRLAREKRILPRTKNSMFPWFAAVVWAVALYLFEYHSHTLQPSLRSSMTYLYHDSMVWNSFRNFLIYNK